jgi:hypothetical protein
LPLMEKDLLSLDDHSRFYTASGIYGPSRCSDKDGGTVRPGDGH